MKQLSTALERIRIVSAALGRFVVIGTSSFVLASATNWQNHQSYWHGTIVRVQTTDFNLLSHTLPTKLSYALLRQDTTELQNTLDSNYGLFGLVITDCTKETSGCSGQRILYVSNSKRDWRKNLQVDQLPNYSYDYLRNPPPLVAEGKYDNSRDLSRDPTGKTNAGQIIGRVYYVRSNPPLFLEDYWGWLEKLPGSLPSDRAAERYYSLTLIFFGLGGLAAWGSIEWILQRKRLQKRLALQKQTQLQEQFHHQLQRQNSLLTELERHRRQREQQSQTYKREINDYESLLAQKQQKQQRITDDLNNLQQRLQEMQQQQDQEQLEQHEQEITLLQDQIYRLQIEKDQNDKSLKDLQDELQLARQQASDADAHIRTLDQTIAAVTEERDSAVQKIQELENAQATLAITLELKEAEVEQFQRQIQELEEFQAYAEQDNEQLSQQIQILTQAKGLLIRERDYLIRERDDLKVELWNFNNQLSTIDLSEKSLALVGGKARMRRRVFEELSKHYKLPKRQCVEIPSLTEKNIDKGTLKDRIDGCDLIAVFTDYIGHDLTNMVSDLSRSGALSGRIVWVEGGKTGIVQSILEGFRQLSRNDNLNLETLKCTNPQCPNR